MDGRPLGIGRVTAWKRTGDRLEEDGWPPGRGRVTAWNRMGAITEEAGFRPAVLQKAANRGSSAIQVYSITVPSFVFVIAFYVRLLL